MKKAKTKKNNTISRKEAIKKTGWAALTASSVLFLETKAHASASTPSSLNRPNRNPRSG